MPHTYTNLLYHIVFSTKDRLPFITPTIRPRLYEYMGGAIRGTGGICLEIGGIEDHIHLLVKLKPTLPVSEFLRELKPNVTNWARRELNAKFEWQNGYGAFSVGESQVASVRGYIQNQVEHHKRVSFEEEFKTLLIAAGMEFDERYLWT
ncbi:MAG: IS200/IS605 family transposase [Acidobacteria bacterium]|nr:IS200/IS605 family transposase [Acidobacteriota bacterium]